jgi:hypothetical protein
MRRFFFRLFFCTTANLFAQDKDSVDQKIADEILTNGTAILIYAILQAGRPRLSGSAQAEKAARETAGC